MEFALVKEKILIEGIPAILYGVKTDKLYLFVHGKFSQKEEARDFAKIAISKGYQVLSFDLPEHGERKNEGYECTAQNGVKDLTKVYSYVKGKYSQLSLYACSLGAYFSLVAYKDINFSNCLFASPLLNMERLIENMMTWANVNPKELESKKEIDTDFGEKLSWDYYKYVKNNTIDRWESPTHILYGEKDNITEEQVLNGFSNKFNCSVSVMKNGEHHFHTKEQLDFMFNWIRNNIN